MKKKIYQVDAFSREPFKGNPAGVVADARGLSTKDMQNIAREMNLSETVFIFLISENLFEVKFFSPLEEVDLCGHGTIAAFYTLVKRGYIKGVGKGIKRVFQKTKAGKLPVDIVFKDGELVEVLMEQKKPEIVGEINELDPLLDCFNLDREDIGIGNELVFPNIVSTGLPDIMLPIKKREKLDQVEVDFKRLARLSEKLNVTGVHAFYLPKRDSREVYVRNFAPLLGIDEESATGTANGALIYFLKKKKHIDGNGILAIQGESLNRPSEIYCKIEKSNDEYIVKVGGIANIVLEGMIYY